MIARRINAGAHHQQTQGKDERSHRTLKAEMLDTNAFADLAASSAFDPWRPIYDGYRPHQALDLATSSERYRPSRRSFPERLPPIEYGPDDIVRKADQVATSASTTAAFASASPARRPKKHRPPALPHESKRIRN